MFGIETVELIGYLAPLAVLMSFLMKDIKTLKIVNTIGCFFFVVYGFMLAIAWSIIITNMAIMFINFYYLFIKKDTAV